VLNFPFAILKAFGKSSAYPNAVATDTSLPVSGFVNFWANTLSKSFCVLALPPFVLVNVLTFGVFLAFSLKLFIA